MTEYTLHLFLRFWEMLFPSSHISNDKFKPPFKIYNSGCHRDFRRASRTRAEFSRKLQSVWVCIRAPRIFCLWRFPSLRATTDLVHKRTIFLCSLDVGNIDDQCRGPSIKERYHLARLLTTTDHTWLYLIWQRIPTGFFLIRSSC